ncbi:hypothetical protein [Asaccharospora irregularis]|uniref:Uncharacterized protein n=1 Tax=Asaccharospora irregularis DSM 2635 TaxID=1121321 RepID=A0A1M5Q549_9FIRM|nr:hypothetical protein [Asaccharospora irregularis]SHH08980.1 hypothetical protein SAMN04488530_11830 [Asaccharospora irregularis DSM 2635]
MKRKLVLLSMILGVSLGAVACSNNNPKPDENASNNQSEVDKKPDAYTENYSKNYKEYLAGLDEYSIYNIPESVNKAYDGKEYPGNEKYLEEVKTTYKDSREKVQSFVNSLKNDIKIEDQELNKMNKDLIAEGEKLIGELDTKIKRLDEIPKERLKDEKNDFMNAVNDATKVDKDTRSDFNKMIDGMNKRLGIDSKI